MNKYCFYFILIMLLSGCSETINTANATSENDQSQKSVGASAPMNALKSKENANPPAPAGASAPINALKSKENTNPPPPSASASKHAHNSKENTNRPLLGASANMHALDSQTNQNLDEPEKRTEKKPAEIDDLSNNNDGFNKNNILNCKTDGFEYIPIPPLPTNTYSKFSLNKGVDGFKLEEALWPTKNNEVNNLLTNISTVVTVNSNDSSGQTSAGFFSGEASSYKKQYIIDFMKWRAEPINDEGGKNHGWARVGAGMRVIINLKKDNASASGNLWALAASAKAGKIEGSISLDVIGIDAKDVTQSIPFSVDLSEGNIQRVIEAMSVVKSKLYEGSVMISPNYIARIRCIDQQAKYKDKDKSNFFWGN